MIIVYDLSKVAWKWEFIEVLRLALIKCIELGLLVFVRSLSDFVIQVLLALFNEFRDTAFSSGL